MEREIAIDKIINKLEEIRKEQGKSRQELGEELGLHRNTLGNWANNRRRPSAEKLYTLLKYLSNNSETVFYLRSQKTFIDFSSKTLWHVRTKEGSKVAKFGENFATTLSAIDYYLESPSIEKVDNPKEVAEEFTMSDLDLDFTPEEVLDRFEGAVDMKIDPFVVGELFKESLRLLFDMDRDTEWAERQLVRLLVQKSTVFRVSDAIRQTAISDTLANSKKDKNKDNSWQQEKVKKFLKAVESHRERNDDEEVSPENTEEFLDKLDDDLGKI